MISVMWDDSRGKELVQWENKGKRKKIKEYG